MHCSKKQPEPKLKFEGKKKGFVIPVNSFQMLQKDGWMLLAGHEDERVLNNLPPSSSILANSRWAPWPLAGARGRAQLRRNMGGRQEMTPQNNLLPAHHPSIPLDLSPTSDTQWGLSKCYVSFSLSPSFPFLKQTHRKQSPRAQHVTLSLISEKMLNPQAICSSSDRRVPQERGRGLGRRGNR